MLFEMKFSSSSYHLNPLAFEASLPQSVVSRMVHVL